MRAPSMSSAFPESAEPITLYRRIMRNSRKKWERRQKDGAPEGAVIR